MQPSLSSHTAPQFAGLRRGLDPGRVLVGLVVLTVGILYLLQSFDVVDAGRAIDRWWPMAIVALGVTQLAARTRSALGSLVVAGIGVLLLLATTDVLKGDAWSYVWPVAIVAVGASILLHRTGARAPAGVVAGSATTADDGDVVTASGFFGGPELHPTSQRFRQGSLTAVFGGVTLDLRGARLDPAGAAITATAAFGGIEIIVPRGWRIAMKGTPIFGGISDKTDPTDDLAADAPVLRIDGLALFGGIEVKHKK